MSAENAGRTPHTFRSVHGRVRSQEPASATDLQRDRAHQLRQQQLVGPTELTTPLRVALVDARVVHLRAVPQPGDPGEGAGGGRRVPREARRPAGTV